MDEVSLALATPGGSQEAAVLSTRRSLDNSAGRALIPQPWSQQATVKATERRTYWSIALPLMELGGGREQCGGGGRLVAGARGAGEEEKKWNSSLPPQMPERFGFPGRDTPSSSPGADAGRDQGENTGFSIQLGDRGPGAVLYRSVVSSVKWEQSAALCQPHLRTCSADSTLSTAARAGLSFHPGSTA